MVLFKTVTRHGTKQFLPASKILFSQSYFALGMVYLYDHITEAGEKNKSASKSNEFQGLQDVNLNRKSAMTYYCH